jgi:hypothetical protein
MVMTHPGSGATDGALPPVLHLASSDLVLPSVSAAPVQSASVSDWQTARRAGPWMPRQLWGFPAGSLPWLDWKWADHPLGLLAWIAPNLVFA